MKEQWPQRSLLGWAELRHKPTVRLLNDNCFKKDGWMESQQTSSIVTRKRWPNCFHQLSNKLKAGIERPSLSNSCLTVTVLRSKVKENEERPLHFTEHLLWPNLQFCVMWPWEKQNGLSSLICISGQGSRCRALYKQAACKSRLLGWFEILH